LLKILILEAQNAPDSHEQGRFVYFYGGDPVGAFWPKATRPALGGVSHAIFFDQTHDNPSPCQVSVLKSNLFNEKYNFSN
jgi:glycogen debranching enzyme